MFFDKCLNLETKRNKTTTKKTDSSGVGFFSRFACLGNSVINRIPLKIRASAQAPIRILLVVLNCSTITIAHKYYRKMTIM